ncbi:MAG: glycoside hydrolase family 57 [Lentisphaeria bacterium]
MSQPAPKIVFLPHGNLQYSQLPPGKRRWVIEHCYAPLFDLVDAKGYRLAFEASGFTVDAIASLCPRVMDRLAGLVRAGQIEPVGSPYIHIMLGNIDPAVGLETLKKGRQAWEKHTGVAPTLGWNPECSWADYIPEIFKAAGFESLVMDGDSFYLAFDAIRQATGLTFDVAGHSNKDKLFRIDDAIAARPELIRFLTNPSAAPNGLKLLFRSDMMANPMLWYLMGATEGVRETPVTIGEIRAILEKWRGRIAQTGSFIMPFAEDAEYIGSSAYFYVKQFGQARFFEPEPDSVTRFAEMLDTARELGYELATPSDVLAGRRDLPVAAQITEVENGIAWHGGTAKAWANTVHARLLDPVCRMVLAGIESVAARTGKTLATVDGDLRVALERLTGAYVSDSRWPPPPTSPGRFNVQESIDDLHAANQALGAAMGAAGLAAQRSIYSPQLMKTQIDAMAAELMRLPYFGE